MPSQVRPVELRSVLNRWDQAARPARERILHEFVQKNHSKTAPELEIEFRNGASLFLTRLCAYMKTSVSGKGSVGMTFQAISIFIAAASGNRFLHEFIDVGGLEILVEVLKDDQNAENDRLRALQLLSSISACGSKYKDLILVAELEAIPAICGFVVSSENGPVQELSRIVLVNLGQSKSCSDILQRNLIQLLKSKKPMVQRTASQIFRQLLAPLSVEGTSPLEPIPTLVDAVSGMFSCSHAHIIYESLELAMCALVHPTTRLEMVTKTTSLLRPEPYRKPPDGVWNVAPSVREAGDFPPVPQDISNQAAAARLVSTYLNSKDQDKNATREMVVKLCVECDLVANLIVALANTDFAESKKHALDALRSLIKWSRGADTQFHSLVGSEFHDLFHADPNGSSQQLDYSRLNALLQASNNARLQFFRVGEAPEPQEGECIREGFTEDDAETAVDSEGLPNADRNEFQSEK